MTPISAEAPREGGCRCGRVRIRIAAPPLLAMACHCRGCQRMSASAYSLSAAIPADAFAVTRGEVFADLTREYAAFLEQQREETP